MKSIIILASFVFSNLIFGQEIGKVTVSTGDVDLDKYVSDMNKNAAVDFDAYKKEMTTQFGISAAEVERYVKTEKVTPGDLYYGCSLSKESKKPVSDVMKSYKKNKAWGKTAQDLGIKPGSEEFKNFKGKTLKGKNSSVDKNKEENKSQNKNQNQIQKQNQNNIDKAPNTNSKSKK